MAEFPRLAGVVTHHGGAGQRLSPASLRPRSADLARTRGHRPKLRDFRHMGTSWRWWPPSGPAGREPTGNLEGEQITPNLRKKAMSAVSSQAPRAADLSEPSPSQSSATAAAVRENGQGNGTTPANADFGANEWLVDELYQRYLADPASVDRAWWSFFADYRPRAGISAAPVPQGDALPQDEAAA